MSSVPSRRSAARVLPSAIDRHLLETVASYHGVTAPLLMRTYFDGHARSGVYKRLARLVGIGLLEDLRTGPSNRSRPRDVPALYVPTRAGLAWVGSSLPCTPVPLATTKHTLAVAEVGLGIESRYEGVRVLTDRELRQEIAMWRSQDGTATPVAAAWLGTDELSTPQTPRWDIPAKPKTHCPDLVLRDRDGGLAAIEVELTAKNEARLRSTLEMYARASKYRRVDYVVPDERMERTLERALSSMAPEDRPTNLSVVRRSFLHV